MKHVFIPGPFSIPIQRQFKDTNLIWGDTKFTFDEKEQYDFLVVIDELSQPIETNCPPSRRFLFCGEPPMVKRYTRSFRKQFGIVFTCQKKLIKSNVAKPMIPLLPWMLGCKLKTGTHICIEQNYLRYDDFKHWQNNNERLNKACILTSNKTFTKGHRDRVKFVEKILNSNIDFIDIYGNGYNAVDDKLEVLSSYKYCIVIENCQYDNYWTEKLADCILAGCCPIYYGAPNIMEFFPKAVINTLDIKEYAKAISQIKKIIDNNAFDDFIKDEIYLRDKILHEYNMFAIIDKIISRSTPNEILIYKEEREKEVIMPMKYSFCDRILSKIHWLFNI